MHPRQQVRTRTSWRSPEQSQATNRYPLLPLARRRSVGCLYQAAGAIAAKFGGLALLLDTDNIIIGHQKHDRSWRARHQVAIGMLRQRSSLSVVLIAQAELYSLIHYSQNYSEHVHFNRSVNLHRTTDQLQYEQSHSGTKVCRYNWHSAGSRGWPFPMLKYKYIF